MLISSFFIDFFVFDLGSFVKYHFINYSKNIFLHLGYDVTPLSALSILILILSILLSFESSLIFICFTMIALSFICYMAFSLEIAQISTDCFFLVNFIEHMDFYK
jgi:hypothetical protein